MKRSLRIACFFLSLAILAPLSACAKKDESQSSSTTEQTTITESTVLESTTAPTNTPTPVPTNTPTPSPKPTETPTPVPTHTPTPKPTATPTPKPTKAPKPTKTPEPTNTPIPSDPTLPPTESTPEPTSAPSSTEPTKPKYDLKKIEYAIKVIKNHGFKVWEHLHNGQYEKKDGKWEIVGGDWKEYDVDGSIMFTRTIYYRGECKWRASEGRWYVSYEITPDGRNKYGSDYDYSYWENGTDLDALLNGITVDE